MEKTRVLIISVIILVVLNVATLGFMLLNKPNHRKGHHSKDCCNKEQRCEKRNHHKGHRHKGDKCDRGGKNHKGDRKHDPKHLMIEKLDFDEAQTEQFEAFKKEHHEEVTKLHEEKKEAKKDLFNLLKKDPLDENQKNILISKSVDLEKRMIESKIKHFEEVKKICNEDQLETYLEMIDQMSNKMHHKNLKYHNGGAKDD